MFSLIITYIKLILPTHDVMIVGLQDRSPLHMLPYPTHAHPTMSARRHANSQPNPIDHNLRKYHGRSGPSGHPTDVHVCGAPQSRRSTQGLDEYINIKSLNRNELGRTDATRIPMQHKMQKWSDWYPNGSPRFTNHQVPRKPEKIGRHAKWGKNPKFWKTYEIKTHLTLGHKNPKNPKINEIGHRMQKRPA